MNKKEAFKVFANNHPELVNKVNNGETTWQKLYETYDIYGENSEVWNNLSRNNQESISIGNLLKKVNMENLQGTINNAQKALSVISEFTAKGAENVNNLPKGPDTPRPLNKFFGD